MSDVEELIRSRDTLPAIRPDKALAMEVLGSATSDEKVALRHWLETLVSLNLAKQSRFSKLRQAVSVTYESWALWNVIKLIFAKAKQLGGQRHGSAAKWGVTAAAIGLAFFGGQSAGIAALGGAIGVPLWIVFGSGTAFANILIKELTLSIEADLRNKRVAGFADVGDIIDAEYVDMTGQGSPRQ